jgi:protein SCO1/2
MVESRALRLNQKETGGTMQKNVILAVGGALAVVLLVWAVAFARPYTLHGSEINPTVPAPPIQLPRPDGSTFDLAALQGRIALIFFGYTSCPDVCPTSLADMKRIKAGLGSQAGQVEFVFISVDPQRDTPERVQGYVSGFDPTFVGLSGSQERLEPVWKAYGVYRQVQEGATALGYLVDHSTRSYLIDIHGNLRLTYAYGTPVEDIVRDIRHLLKEDQE